MREKLIAALIFILYSALKLTWRIRIVESPGYSRAIADKRPMVIAHWHADIPCIIFMLKRYSVAAIISSSKDGELVALITKWLGGHTSRGSSHRGGAAALKGLLRLTKEGWRPSVATDGPKGPREIVKPGVLEISRIVQGEIFVVGAAADREWIFRKAWDQTRIPKPFAKVVCVWSEGIPTVSRDADSRDPKLAESLGKAITDAGQQARNLIAAN